MFGILRGGVAVCVDVDFLGGKGLPRGGGGLCSCSKVEGLWSRMSRKKD